MLPAVYVNSNILPKILQQNFTRLNKRKSPTDGVWQNGKIAYSMKTAPQSLRWMAGRSLVENDGLYHSKVQQTGRIHTVNLNGDISQ